MALLHLGSQLVPVLDVVLRVPPLFILDSILNGTLTVPWVPDDRIRYLGVGEPLVSLYGLNAILTCCVCLVLIFLTTTALLSIYSLLLACGSVIISYRIQCFYAAFLLVDSSQGVEAVHNSTSLSMLIRVVLSQCCLAFCYQRLIRDSNLSQCNSRVWRFVQSSLHIYLLFLAPVILMLTLRHRVHIHILSETFIVVIALHIVVGVLLEVKSVVQYLLNSITSSRENITAYGLTTYIETQWKRLNVPWMLRVFWLVRCSLLLAYFIWHGSGLTDACLSHTLIHGCETMLAVLGMTSCVAYAMHLFGSSLFFIAGHVARDDDKEIATTTAILFFILALQSGLTGLDDGSRLVRVYRNLSLLVMAAFHFIHTGIRKYLMSLGASYNDMTSAEVEGRVSPQFLRHARVVTVMLSLCLLSIAFTVYLWSHNSVGTWILAITAFCIELVVKTIITLATYTLFITSNDSLDTLDDRVYVLQATGNTIEFVCGIFLFFNGVWILMYESRGFVRAVMMCMHAYFNIIVQAKEGWATFMKRRTASMKINRLCAATEEDVRVYADVCAICYQELRAGGSARKTECKHMFHGACLRRWLYIQDQCPLCHQNIYNEGNTTSEGKDSEVIQGGVQGVIQGGND